MRLPLAGLLVAALLVGVPMPSSAAGINLEGTGATGPELVLRQWIADADPDQNVVYLGGGSERGRADFAAGRVDFALTEVLGDTADRAAATFPVLGGATAFPYQLRVDERQVRDLRLSGETLTRIFTHEITSWADPAIAGDNNGRALPAIPITPVVRSDGSGATALVTRFFDEQAPAAWRSYQGRSGETEHFPGAGTTTTAYDGSDALVRALADGDANGSIGYVALGHALNLDLPSAAVRNRTGTFVAPTSSSAAVALTDPADARAYPLSSYTSVIVPAAADDPRTPTVRRQALVDFWSAALCDGQAKASYYGSSPLPLRLVRSGLEQLAAVAAADPAVRPAGLDPAACANPTFDAAHPDRNRMADLAPAPQACDRAGAGPCGTLPGPGAWPTLSGPATVGAAVHATPGSWSGPGPFDYQWLLDGQPLVGATGPDLVVPPAAAGRELGVRVLSHGMSAVPEDTTASVRVAPGQLDAVRPRIAGKAQLGRTLRVRPAGGSDTRVRWYADGRLVRGAHGDTLRLTRRQLGHRLTVRLTISRPGYVPVTAISRPTARVRRTTRTG